MRDKGNNLTKGFLIIPQEILTTVKYKGKPLGFPEKALYSYLLHWSNGHEKVFPSSKTMCEDLGVGSRTSIKKYLDKLVELNLLSIEKVKGRSSIYTVLPFEGYEVSKVNIKSIEKGTNCERDQNLEDDKQREPLTTNPFDNLPGSEESCSACGSKLEVDGLCYNCIPF